MAQISQAAHSALPCTYSASMKAPAPSPSPKTAVAIENRAYNKHP